MKAKIHIYSIVLLGIFIVSLGLRAVHFLEHYNQEVTAHKCDNHNHHSDQHHDCSLCDFTVSSFTEFDFFTFEPFVSTLFNPKINTAYIAYLWTSEYQFSSLRAPPLV